MVIFATFSPTSQVLKKRLLVKHTLKMKTNVHRQTNGYVMVYNKYKFSDILIAL